MSWPGASCWRTGSKTPARGYLLEAIFVYTRWGGVAKVTQLEEEFTELLAGFRQVRTPRTTSIGTGTAGQMAPSGFDFGTVLKALEAISTELVLPDLVASLIRIAMENAGADRGLLLLQGPDGLEPYAERVLAQTEDAVLKRFDSGQSFDELLPARLVHFVVRTRDTVVLNFEDSRFSEDPYFEGRAAGSALCGALAHRGELVGVLYLENQLTHDAFTADHLEVLRLISGQAGISIANARLYQNLEDAGQRLNKFLEALPVGIFVSDSKGVPHFLNETASQLLGRGVSEGRPGPAGRSLSGLPVWH